MGVLSLGILLATTGTACIIAIRKGWPVGPTICLAFGGTLLAFGLWLIVSQSTAIVLSNAEIGPGQSLTRTDTYFLDAGGHYLASSGILFLGIAAVTYVIARMGDRWTQRAMEGALALLLLSTVISLTAHLWWFPGMPRRYADYPEVFAQYNRIFAVTATTSFLALCVIGVCLLVALMQRGFRR